MAREKTTAEATLEANLNALLGETSYAQFMAACEDNASQAVDDWHWAYRVKWGNGIGTPPPDDIRKLMDQVVAEKAGADAAHEAAQEQAAADAKAFQDAVDAAVKAELAKTAKAKK